MPKYLLNNPLTSSSSPSTHKMAMLSPTSLTLFLTFSFLIHNISAICHKEDEAGLLGFKSGIQSDPSGILSTWKRGTDCCKWKGVGCEDNRVFLLSVKGEPDYPNEYLTGTISPSLVKLQYLYNLFLTNLGNVSGTFPTFIFDLPNLKNVFIENNKLSGPLPADIGRLSRFESLSLSGNRFTGSIPSSISKLTHLGQLILGGNRLTGPIPKGIGKLKRLTILDLKHNQLSGEIPDFFNSLSDLRLLALSHNRFSGWIPASISSLSLKLGYLHLDHNHLTGSIPDYLGNFQSLDTLDLSFNQFTGFVPKTFKNLTKIITLNLSRNKLINPFPEMNVQAIELLDLSYNQFKLRKIPKWVFSSPIIYSLKLAGCGIKMKFEDFKPLETYYYDYIDLSDNQIWGSPIRLLNRTRSLLGFAASGNRLKFNMSDLKLPTTLKNLDLSRNLIFGNVPGSILDLVAVNLSHNHLCGKLPVNKFPVSSFEGNVCLCGSPLPRCKN